MPQLHPLLLPTAAHCCPVPDQGCGSCTHRQAYTSSSPPSPSRQPSLLPDAIVVFLLQGPCAPPSRDPPRLRCSLRLIPKLLCPFLSASAAPRRTHHRLREPCRGPYTLLYHVLVTPVICLHPSLLAPSHLLALHSLQPTIVLQNRVPALLIRRRPRISSACIPRPRRHNHPPPPRLDPDFDISHCASRTTHTRTPRHGKQPGKGVAPGLLSRTEPTLESPPAQLAHGSWPRRRLTTRQVWQRRLQLAEWARKQA